MKILSALAAIAFAAGALAQETPAQPETPAQSGAPVQSGAPAEAPAPATVSFESLDTNHNGLLNRHEAKADPALARRFAALDRNVDHQVDKAEFARFEAPAQRPDTTAPK